MQQLPPMMRTALLLAAAAAVAAASCPPGAGDACTNALAAVGSGEGGAAASVPRVAYLLDFGCVLLRRWVALVCVGNPQLCSPCPLWRMFGVPH